MSLIKIKLNHWLNIRKTTVDVLNEMLSKHLNFSLSFDNLDKLDEHAIEKIAEVLSIPKNKRLEYIILILFIDKLLSKMLINNYVYLG